MTKSTKRLTQQQFVNEATRVHGNKYSYTYCNYMGSRAHIKVLCSEHGIFEINPRSHLKGFGCSRCSNRCAYSTKEYVEKVEKVHNYKYDYSITEYINAKTPIKYICPVHGEFEQSPRIHLKGSGCSRCAGNMLPQEDFLQKVIEIHGNKLDYSLMQYKNARTNVLTRCIEHNTTISISPKSILKGFYGCAKCRVKTTSVFIAQAIAVHGQRYDYSSVEYARPHDKIKIICKVHGQFLQAPSNHLEGSGCKSCNVTGYSRTSYVKHCDYYTQGLSNFYIIKVYSKDEEFYKVGITCRTLSKRYVTLKQYEFKKIIFLEKLGAGLVFDLEKHLLLKYKQFKYTPKNTFAGQTECFSSLPNNYMEDITEYIKNYKDTND